MTYNFGDYKNLSLDEGINLQRMQLQRYTPVEVVQESCNQQQIENVSPFCVLEM